MPADLALATPGSRPLRGVPGAALQAMFAAALEAGDGVAAAHAIHELWMRGELPSRVERMQEALWLRAAAAVPEWLPMNYVEWLPVAYEVCARFAAPRRGRSNIYLVLLDYADSREGPHGVYVGMSRYPAAERFDQHKAGIRHAGSVLKRGLEPLIGPVLHLQSIPRAAATDFEGRLAEALRAEGIMVQGGH
jgi:hypothetical protein